MSIREAIDAIDEHNDNMSAFLESMRVALVPYSIQKQDKLTKRQLEDIVAELNSLVEDALSIDDDENEA